MIKNSYSYKLKLRISPKLRHFTQTRILKTNDKDQLEKEKIDLQNRKAELKEEYSKNEVDYRDAITDLNWIEAQQHMSLHNILQPRVSVNPEQINNINRQLNDLSEMKKQCNESYKSLDKHRNMQDSLEYEVGSTPPVFPEPSSDSDSDSDSDSRPTPEWDREERHSERGMRVPSTDPLHAKEYIEISQKKTEIANNYYMTECATKKAVMDQLKSPEMNLTEDENEEVDFFKENLEKNQQNLNKAQEEREKIYKECLEVEDKLSENKELLAALELSTKSDSDEESKLGGGEKRPRDGSDDNDLPKKQKTKDNSSLLDDYADPSTEPADYTGGDD